MMRVYAYVHRCGKRLQHTALLAAYSSTVSNTTCSHNNSKGNPDMGWMRCRLLVQGLVGWGGLRPWRYAQATTTHTLRSRSSWCRAGARVGNLASSALRESLSFFIRQTGLLRGGARAVPAVHLLLLQLTPAVVLKEKLPRLISVGKWGINVGRWGAAAP